MRYFLLNIVINTCHIHEATGCLNQHFITFRHIESSPSHAVLDAIILQRVLKHHGKPSIKTCLFTPTLINSVHRIVAIDAVSHRINIHKAFSMIIIRVHYNISLAVFLIGETEHCRMTHTCHLGLQMLIGQRNSIIIRMSNLVSVVETCGSINWFQAQTIH